MELLDLDFIHNETLSHSYVAEIKNYEDERYIEIINSVCTEVGCDSANRIHLGLFLETFLPRVVTQMVNHAEVCLDVDPDEHVCRVTKNIEIIPTCVFILEEDKHGVYHALGEIMIDKKKDRSAVRYKPNENCVIMEYRRWVPVINIVELHDYLEEYEPYYSVQFELELKAAIDKRFNKGE